jgi:phospholipid/cholesterol/gamma-HCH transport system substrate-binding protein
MSVSKETRIGIVALIAVAFAFGGYKFLKGANVLTTSQTFYVKYGNVDQLRPSAPVFINGLQIGTVKDIRVDKTDDKTLIAVLSVDRGIQVPKDAIAAIIGLSLMGGKAIELVIPHPCDGDDCAESESYLRGETRSLARSLLGDPNDLNAYVERVRAGFDSLANPNDPNGLGPSVKALQDALQGMADLTELFKDLVKSSSSGITKTSNNAADITESLRNSNSDISKALANLKELSEELKNAGLGNTTAKATAAIDSVIQSVTTLKGTLTTTESAVGRVGVLAQNLSDGQGSMGKLLTDDELYNNLERITRQLALLEQDLRLNPQRYTNVRVRLFGKHKGVKYESPINDPAYARLLDSLERDYRMRQTPTPQR